MALKDLLKAADADRYTQDGRDELNAALQADVEDRTYKTGDISQKTGLQKQPDGSWAPPKKGGKTGAGEKKPTQKRPKNIRWDRNNMQTMHENADYITPQQADNFYHQYGLDKTGEHKDRKGWTIKEYKNDDGDIYRAKFNQQDKYIGYDFEPAAGSKLESDFDDEGDSTGTNWQEKVEQNPRDGYNFEKMIQHRIPTSQTDKEELKGLRSFMNEEKATYQNALKSRAQALVDGNKSNGDWYPEKEQSILKIAKAVGFDDDLHKFIEEEFRGYDFGYSEDAAPRQLTGDTKIRVRK